MTLSRASVWGSILAVALVAFAAGRFSADVELVQPDRVEAVGNGLAAGGSLNRINVLGSALGAIELENLSGMVAEYDRGLSALSECEIAPFVDQWTRLSLEGAVAGIEKWPYMSKREIGLRTAVENVTVRDPAEGLALYETLRQRNPAFQEELQIGLLSGLASAPSLEPLMAYWQSLPEGGLGSALGMSMGLVIRHKGSEPVIGLVEELLPTVEDPLVKAKVFRKAVRTVSRYDPMRAADWAFAHWGEEYAEAGPGAVAEGWILVDPVATLEWLENEAPQESRQGALELVFGRWLHEDRQAAVEWLEVANRTAFRDPAISTFARSRVGKDPELAMEWCGKVIEPESREVCYTTTVGQWARKRPGAALNWLSESPLDEEARTTVRSRVQARMQQKRKASQHQKSAAGG